MGNRVKPQRAVILTALPEEYLAVRAHLTDVAEINHSKGTVYEKGEFSSDKGVWEVIITETGAGNEQAAVEAERAIQYFDPNILLFVGVAGGIKDVKIGDVVVGTKVYGYGSGKAGQIFQSRPEVGECSYRLIQRARAERKKTDWLRRLGESLPDPLPSVYIAPIAAGPMVLSSKRSEAFRFIRFYYNDAIAVEMEGIGTHKAAHANTPIDMLIVRGISDLINKKNVGDEATRQKMASRHASAFAFEILAKLEDGNLEKEKLPNPEKDDEAHSTSDESLSSYLRNLDENYTEVNYRGIGDIAEPEPSISLPLERIYTIPSLVPEDLQETTRQQLRAILKELDSPFTSAEKREKLEQEYKELMDRNWKPDIKERKGFSFVDLVKKERHIVVTGAPGVGKSTLIYYLAQTCARGKEVMQERLGWAEEVIPVVVSLAEFADSLQHDARLTIREFLDKKLIAKDGEVLRARIGEELKHGRVWLMLDGVDETSNRSINATLVRAVEKFVADYKSNRCLITSRPYEYTHIEGKIRHFQLLNFSPAQTETYVRNWHAALELRRKPNDPDFTRSKGKAEGLLNDIKLNQGLTDLAANPLLLTILCLIHLEDAHLPEQRVQLYYRTVKTLMETWNYWRSSFQVDTNSKKLSFEQLLQVWAAVAEWTHKNNSTGIIHRADLRRFLVRILTEKKLDECNPSATADSYLNVAAARTGLLEERGRDLFAFWHSTFEEFLAAVELVTPLETAVSRLLPLREESRWREVILLAVGYVGDILHDCTTATEIVKSINRDTPSPAEPLLHRNLRLAAACISDKVRVNPSLVEQILIQLAIIVKDQPYNLAAETFVETVASLPNFQPDQETIRSLSHLTKHEEWQIRREAARLFSYIADRDADALYFCQQLLTDDDPDVRCHAALGLARTGDYRPVVWQALAGFQRPLARIEPAVREFFATLPKAAIATMKSYLSAPDLKLRYDISHLLHGLGWLDTKVLNALESCLSSDDLYLRYTVIQELKSLGCPDEKLVDALVSCVATRDLHLHYEASSMLFEMAKANEHVVSLLEPYLSSNNFSCRIEMARLLRKFEQKKSSVVEAMLSGLNLTNIDHKLAVARLLLDTEMVTDTVVEALFAWLNDSDVNLRVNAALILNELGKTNEDLIKSVLSWTIDDNLRLRIGAVRILSKIWPPRDQLEEILIPWLTSGEHEQRHEALDILYYRAPSERVISAFFQCLNSEDLELRIRAASHLTEMGQGDERLANAVRPGLSVDDLDIRIQAARFLLDIGIVDMQVIYVLITCLEKGNPLLKSEAAHILWRMGRFKKKVVDMYLGWLEEPDSYFHDAAWKSLLEMAKEDKNALQRIIGCLESGSLRLRYQVSRLLLTLKVAESEVITALVGMVDSNPSDTLTAFNRALNRNELSKADGEVLARLININSADKDEQRWARRWLFHKLRQVLEPHEQWTRYGLANAAKGAEELAAKNEMSL